MEVVVGGGADAANRDFEHDFSLLAGENFADLIHTRRERSSGQLSSPVENAPHIEPYKGANNVRWSARDGSQTTPFGACNQVRKLNGSRPLDINSTGPSVSPKWPLPTPAFCRRRGHTKQRQACPRRMPPVPVCRSTLRVAQAPARRRRSGAKKWRSKVPGRSQTILCCCHSLKRDKVTRPSGGSPMAPRFHKTGPRCGSVSPGG